MCRFRSNLAIDESVIEVNRIIFNRDELIRELISSFNHFDWICIVGTHVLHCTCREEAFDHRKISSGSCFDIRDWVTCIAKTTTKKLFFFLLSICLSCSRRLECAYASTHGHYSVNDIALHWNQSKESRIVYQDPLSSFLIGKCKKKVIKCCLRVFTVTSTKSFLINIGSCIVPYRLLLDNFSLFKLLHYKQGCETLFLSSSFQSFRMWNSREGQANGGFFFFLIFSKIIN